MDCLTSRVLVVAFAIFITPFLPHSSQAGATLPAGGQSEDEADSASGESAENALAGESSPYLLSHAHNPVAWNPWGPDALERARRENKPIFLSIGYSSCYWCHVMERKVFSSQEIAEWLNDHFVCIKVDREERPDLDDIYMTSLIVYQQASGRPGSGGWPLSMFLTPDGNPIAGATYLGPEDTSDGRPGFLSVARRVHEAWRVQEPQLRATAELIAGEVRRLSDLQAGQLPEDAGEPRTIDAQLRATRDAVLASYDEEFGGVDFDPRRPNSPRFPNVPRLEFLSLWATDSEDTEAMGALRHSLQAMAAGGMRDHLGGGFHRYSTDRRWHVPHFEKMLYDQAQLLSIYTAASQLEGMEEFGDVASGIARFVLRRMTRPEGGFCSALDAETDAVEGAYYVWKDEELQELLSKEDYGLFSECYGLRAENPFEHGYVLHLPQPLTAVAESRDLSLAELNNRLQGIRGRLLQVRQQREKPFLDDKVIVAWNGMMISSLARYGATFQDQAALAAAGRCADFLMTELRDDLGRLQRSWRDGRVSGQAYLDDYVWLVAGLLDLHAATGDSSRLEAAAEWAELQQKLFRDSNSGVLYFTASDHEALMARSSGVFDQTSPAAVSVAARNLIRLAEALEDEAKWSEAESVLRPFQRIASLNPAACAGYGVALMQIRQARKVGAMPAGLQVFPVAYTLRGSRRAAGSADPLFAGEQSSPRDGLGAPRQEKMDENSAGGVDAATHFVFRPVMQEADRGPFRGAAGVPTEGQVKAKVYPYFNKLPRGGQCLLSIELEIEEPWHINANPPKPDYLVPTEVSLESSRRIKLVKTRYPKGKSLVTGGSTGPVMVYGGRIRIFGLLEIDETVPEGPTELRIRVKYQACDDTQCLRPAEVILKGRMEVTADRGEIRRVFKDKFPKPDAKPADSGRSLQGTGSR